VIIVIIIPVSITKFLRMANMVIRIPFRCRGVSSTPTAFLGIIRVVITVTHSIRNLIRVNVTIRISFHYTATSVPTAICYIWTLIGVKEIIESISNLLGIVHTTRERL